MRPLPTFYPLIAYYPLLEIMVCAFNVVLFVLLSYYCIRDYRNRKTKWGGYLYAWVVVLCAILFTANLANDFATEFAHRRFYVFDYFEIVPKYFVPPLMMHLFYRNEKDYLRFKTPWIITITMLYAAALIFALAEINTGVWHCCPGWPGWGVVRPLFRTLMMAAAAGSGCILWTRGPVTDGRLDEKRRQWLMYLCFAWALTFLTGMFLPESANGILEKVIPLCFVFVITYYVERFTFFDVVIKKGSFVFASLFLLALYFVTAPPVLLWLGMRTWIGTLVWSLSVWPIVLLAPWGHRVLSEWVDHRLLGRRFTPAQATHYFLSGLQGSIDEDDLFREAEAHLSTIFRSKAGIVLGASFFDHRPADSMNAPIRLNGKVIGEIRVREREASRRFLSEDMALLQSLADGLAFLVENLRLREQRLHQEQREQELLVHAQRSELKALRAQINPHFLFNALNTIAALIPRQPGRAEETVEELAEVFRYTLRRSEREWVRLEDELEAVRAYLHIEQARFGEGLQFHIETSGEASNAQIPAMCIQTLVENSIKHGIAPLGSRGIVEVTVNVMPTRLRIEVRDNGRGFEESLAATASRTGYGLRNVKERLHRYFGETGELSIGRDTKRGMTLVSIEMPREAQVLGASTT